MKKKLNLGLVGSLVMMTMVFVLVTAIVIVSFSIGTIGNVYDDVVLEELRATGNHLVSQLSYEYDGEWELSEEGILLKGGVDVHDEFETQMNALKDKTGIEYTLFYDNTPMVTTAVTKNGESLMDGGAEKKIADAVLNQGKEYYSPNVRIKNADYYVYYIPLENSDGSVVGMVVTTRSAGDLKKQIAGVVILLLAISAAILVVVAIIGFVVNKNVSAKMRQVANSITKISGGALDTEISAEIAARGDEIGELGSSATGLVLKLKDIMQKIQKMTDNLITSGNELTVNSESAMEAANQVSTAVDGISRGAVSQADSIQTAVASTTVMGDNIRYISDNVEQLNDASKKMQQSCVDTKDTLELLIKQSKKVSDSVSTISTTIDSTDKSAKEISEFTEAINSIATQTNLLSLNASIEAARAGEAGKGFAVVASEISNLATQSKESADKINEIVAELISDVGESVNVLKVLTEDFTVQEKQLDETKEAMDSMELGISEVTTSAEGIRNQVGDLVEARENLTEVIEDLSAISEENAASAEETNSSMEELTATFTYINESAGNLKNLADDLSDTVSYFG